MVLEADEYRLTTKWKVYICDALSSRDASKPVVVKFLLLKQVVSIQIQQDLVGAVEESVKPNDVVKTWCRGNNRSRQSCGNEQQGGALRTVTTQENVDKKS